MAPRGDMDRAITELLREHGAECIVIHTTGRNHRRLEFRINGRSVLYFLPSKNQGSAGSRVQRNTLAGVRRELRAAKGTPVPGAPEARPVLDASGLHARQPDHMGASRTRVP